MDGFGWIVTGRPSFLTGRKTGFWVKYEKNGAISPLGPSDTGGGIHENGELQHWPEWLNFAVGFVV